MVWRCVIYRIPELPVNAMPATLARLLSLLAGLFFLGDGLLPPVVHTLRLNDRNAHIANYELRFADAPYRCKVNHDVYSRLQNGDQLIVSSSKLAGDCLHIRRGEESLFRSKYLRLWHGIFGLLLIAAACGLLRTDDDGGVVLWRSRN